MTARLARVPEPTSELLQLVPLLPGRADVDLLVALEPDGAAVLEPAEAIGMIEVQGQAVAFRHELARRAVGDTPCVSSGRTTSRVGWGPYVRAIRARALTAVGRWDQAAHELDDTLSQPHGPRAPTTCAGDDCSMVVAVHVDEAVQHALGQLGHGSVVPAVPALG